MADDFLPRADQRFCAWLNQFLQASARGDRATRLRLPSEDLEQLRENSAALAAAMAQQLQFQRQAAAARSSKVALRKACEKSIRQLAWQVTHGPGITPADRVELGLRIAKPRITSAVAEQPPATTPRLRTQSLPLRHLLHFVDEKTPSRKIKPPRVATCAIWRQRQPARTGPTGKRKQGNNAGNAGSAWGWEFLALCSSTPQTVTYTPQDLGQLIAYRCRWVNKRGKQGPWSNTVTALVND